MESLKTLVKETGANFIIICKTVSPSTCFAIRSSFSHHCLLVIGGLTLFLLDSTLNVTSEELLVTQLRAQDQKAIAQLYRNYSAALYGVILRIVKQEEIAEDVLQETFVKIWSAFSTYDENKGRLFTWILNIARNLAIDKIRSKQFRVSSITHPLEDTSTFRMTSSDEIKPEHIGVKEMTDKLNPDQKVIIDLMYFNGYTQSEVAEELNIPLGTVKTRARMAIKFLSKLIK